MCYFANMFVWEPTMHCRETAKASTDRPPHCENNTHLSYPLFPCIPLLPSHIHFPSICFPTPGQQRMPAWQQKCLPSCAMCTPSSTKLQHHSGKTAALDNTIDETIAERIHREDLLCCLPSRWFITVLLFCVWLKTVERSGKGWGQTPERWNTKEENISTPFTSSALYASLITTSLCV